MTERIRIYLCLAHMSEAGLEQKYIKEAFDTNWVVPLGPNVNGFEKDLEQFIVHNSEFIVRLREMGLLKFAKGVMWIEKELLGLDEKYLIVEPSERIGRAILQTNEEGGNFGHHNSINTLRHQNLIGRAIGGTKQWLRALRYFPTEAAWKVIRKII